MLFTDQTPPKLKRSSTLLINETSDQLRAQGRSILKLGLGQSPFPVPDIVVDALKAHAAEKDYLNVAGLWELREAFAEFHNRREGTSYRPEEAIMGPGTKQLLFLAQLAFPGEILIPSPCWVSYIPQAEILGKKLRVLPSTFEDRWKVTPDQLEDATQDGKPRLMILNYPNNPHGQTYDESELRALADVARKNNITVLADEIYGETHYEGAHQSIARYYPEGTILSSGLSKWCGAGGWRIGGFLLPREMAEFHETLAALASESFTSVAAPIQYAAITAYRPSDAIEEYLSGVRGVLKLIGAHCASHLQDANVRVHPPEGGFYAFLDFENHRKALGARGMTDARTLCSRLLEDTGVAMLPADDFGAMEGSLTSRVAFVDFDGGAAIEQLKLDNYAPPDTAAFLSKRLPNVVEAFERLASWL